ncbi:hypothetical protein I3842_15G069500 [Carya illinoinensis]|uniref:Uncharacterized protein n=1 Tax=Carya illinoinensis TaxID=32201 RepID=A0A922A9L7_CARIL|nr:hypothetical protein I3842_15G069500 [Carya illinoinensis]
MVVINTGELMCPAYHDLLVVDQFSVQDIVPILVISVETLLMDSAIAL